MNRLPASIHVTQAWLYQHGDWSVIFSGCHTDPTDSSRWGMHRFSQHLLRHKKRTTVDMHHFPVFFYAFALLETSTFQRQPKLLSSVHFNTLSTWSWSEMLWALFMYTFLMFPYISSQRERALRFHLYQGKMGTYDLLLNVSNEACARWTGTCQV